MRNKIIIICLMVIAIVGLSISIYEYIVLKDAILAKDRAIAINNEVQQRLDQSMLTVTSLKNTQAQGAVTTLKNGTASYHSSLGFSFNFNYDASEINPEIGKLTLVAPYVTSGKNGSSVIHLRRYEYNVNPGTSFEQFTSGQEDGSIILSLKNPNQLPKDYLTSLIKEEGDCKVSELNSTVASNSYNKYYIESISQDWTRDDYCKYASGNGVAGMHFFEHAPGYVAISRFGQDPVTNVSDLLSSLKFDK